MKITICLIVAVIVASHSFPCAAGLIVLSDSRRLDLLAQGDSDFGAHQETYSQDAASSSDNPYQPWSDSAAISSFGAQSAVAESAGVIASLITNTSITGTGNVSGIATILDETGYSAESSARSQLQIGFSVTQHSLWRLNAALASYGAGRSSVLLTDGLDANGSVIFSSSEESIDHLVPLAPGDYTLQVLAEMSAVVWFNTSRSGGATFSASFSQVPEPTSAELLVALIGLSLTARLLVRHGQVTDGLIGLCGQLRTSGRAASKLRASTANPATRLGRLG
jgi:hypothetical protein